MLFQVGAIVRARFVPARYFCRAPCDSRNGYTMEVVVDDQALSPDEIRRRYKKPAKGTDNRSMQRIKGVISGYETSYGAEENAQVTLGYRVNGGEEQSWKRPRR